MHAFAQQFFAERQAVAAVEFVISEVQVGCLLVAHQQELWAHARLRALVADLQCSMRFAHVAFSAPPSPHPPHNT